jgi:uncharacterized protein DUF6627
MRTRPFLAALVATCLLSALPARAEMIGTEQLLAPSADAQRARVEAFLERDDVQRQLEANGVSPADAAGRVASLTPAELQVLSSHMDTLPAGGDVSTLELLLIILIIVIVI